MSPFLTCVNPNLGLSFELACKEKPMSLDTTSLQLSIMGTCHLMFVSYNHAENFPQVQELYNGIQHSNFHMFYWHGSVNNLKNYKKKNTHTTILQMMTLEYKR